jgi:methylmalonyl-CoA/ethylmalonyl-CoA epimerase
MPTIKKINHVALVVDDIEASLRFWRDALGLRLDHIDQVPREESAIAFLPVGDSEIELVQPTSRDSGVAKYLEKRGPGMHHLCLEVDDIQQVIDTLKGKGINLIHDSPVVGEGGRKYIFIHPKAAYGVLVELYELPGGPAPSFPVLETDRLTLREFQMADVTAVFEMYARQDMNQWLEHEPMISILEADRRVRGRMGLFEKGWGVRWAIAFKNSPEKLIGSCGYFSVRIGTHTVEMGYEVQPDNWQQGIMTEALTAVLDYSFSTSALVPVHRIEALVDPENAASIRLLTKLGFSNEGLRRGFGYWKGAYRDVIMFAILSSDWVKN